MPKPETTEQKIERRITGPADMAQVRIEKREDGTEVIVGLGAVYYDGTPRTEYMLWPGVRERIQPGAFERILGEKPDVRGLFNHDPNQVLGRTSKSTMALRSVDAGLEYEILPPDTTNARDVLELLRRGDVDGSSFSFTIRAETRIEDGDETIYELSDFGKLFDVGPVTFPAYTATTAGAAMRSVETQRERPADAKAKAEAREAEERERKAAAVKAADEKRVEWQRTMRQLTD